MSDLQLTFSNGRIFGRGIDMVGDFEMHGELVGDKIYLHKQYTGKHAIEYHGMSIGEGAYKGTWSCYGYPGGNWFIAVVRFSEAANDLTSEVKEIDGT